jgi:adenylate cyclase
LAYSYLGKQEVKNITRPIRVYVVKLAVDVTESGMDKKYEAPAKPSIAVLPFLNPNLANAYGALGQAMALEGEYEAAVTQINKAIRLSPHDPFVIYWIAHLGVAAFANERYEDACYWGRKTIQQNPMFPGSHRLVAASCGQLGRTQEAASELKELLKLMPGMTAEDVRKQVPFKRPGDMKRSIEGLRKAGLKE